MVTIVTIVQKFKLLIQDHPAYRPSINCFETEQLKSFASSFKFDSKSNLKNVLICSFDDYTLIKCIKKLVSLLERIWNYSRYLERGSKRAKEAYVRRVITVLQISIGKLFT